MDTANSTATRRFPNKAGDHADTDDILRAELAAAGIPTLQEAEGKGPDFLADMLRRTSGEVKTSVIGCLHGWEFKRAWTYWIATGPGIEVDAAERLHAEHGRTVRVEGHCGCPSPREQFKGLACGSYHVDDAAGLKALADTIKELVGRQPGEVQRLYELVRHWSGEARRLEDEKLTVWFGSMPESCGRENWTVMLRRKAAPKGADAHTKHLLLTGFTVCRSEYRDRMRYEADSLRFLLGEIDKAPHILDYDANLHSGYVASTTGNSDA